MNAKNKEGFTLIEVLIAVLILAIGITAVMGVLSRALAISQRSEETTQGILELERQFFMLESGEHPDWIYSGEQIRQEDRFIKVEKRTEEGLFCAFSFRVLSRSGSERFRVELFVPEVTA